MDPRDYAARVIHSLITSASLEDLRSWVLHVSNHRGDEIFDAAFAPVAGSPH
jgi:hypothetical protein